MNVLVFLYAISSFASLRTCSIVWRNSDDKVVKHVSYDRSATFKPHFEGEVNELEKLPYGWYYHAYPIDHINKTIIKKLKPIE